MNLFTKLQAEAAAGRPVRVGVIGAGKFGSMFLSQVPSTPGLKVSAVADLSTQRAQAARASLSLAQSHQGAAQRTAQALAPWLA